MSSYTEVNIFTDNGEAKSTALAYKSDGRVNVHIIEANEIIVRDCTGSSAKNAHNQTGSPLYVVVSEIS
jgi:hypothetical protein